MSTHEEDADSTRRIDHAFLRPSFVSGTRVFGRFVLEANLGNGGMGEVWRAYDEKLKERVALKFLLASVAADAVAVDELKEETLRARRLTHPHIVRIHEFYQDDKNSAIAMELVEGTTLAKLQLEQPEKIFPIQVIAPFVAQICDALDYAHSQAKVAHRDIKPSNIFVTFDGIAKIGDFGIARNLAETNARNTNLANRRGVVGTLSYMSPQQLMGEPPSAADDIYSLGVLLYEMLTSKPPFHRGNENTVILQIREKAPLSLLAQRKELHVAGQPIPRDWEDAIIACLAKDPKQRPATAGAIAMRLKSVVPPAQRTSRFAQLFIRSIAVLSLVGLTAGAAFFVWPARFGQMMHLQSNKPAKSNNLVGPKQSSELAEVVSPHLPQTSPQKANSELAQPNPVANENKRFTNSIGLTMIPIGPGRSMSANLVRRRDFSAFATATNAQPGEMIVSVGPEGWQETRGSWQNPGFAQGEDHPVVGVSWQDTQAFCQWLTESENKTGKLSGKQHYRLPTEAEWELSAKHGEDIFPWGESWPPHGPVGNFAGQEVSASGLLWPEDWSSIADYNDNYPRTSPVGAFGTNAAGFADMAGNTLQWCEDSYSNDSPNKVLRGSSWADYQPGHLRIDARQGYAPDFRSATISFRIVLVTDTDSK